MFFFFFFFLFFGYSFIYPIHYDCFPHHLTPISHYRLHPGPLHNSTLRCKVASLGNPAYDPSLKSFEPFVSPRLIHGICLRSTWPPWTHASSPLSLRVTHIFSNPLLLLLLLSLSPPPTTTTLLDQPNPSTPWTLTATLSGPIGRFLFSQLIPLPAVHKYTERCTHCSERPSRRGFAYYGPIIRTAVRRHCPMFISVGLRIVPWIGNQSFIIHLQLI